MPSGSPGKVGTPSADGFAAVPVGGTLRKIRFKTGFFRTPGTGKRQRRPVRGREAGFGRHGPGGRKRTPRRPRKATSRSSCAATRSLFRREVAARCIGGSLPPCSSGNPGSGVGRCFPGTSPLPPKPASSTPCSPTSRKAWSGTHGRLWGRSGMLLRRETGNPGGQQNRTGGRGGTDLQNWPSVRTTAGRRPARCRERGVQGHAGDGGRKVGNGRKIIADARLPAFPGTFRKRIGGSVQGPEHGQGRMSGSPLFPDEGTRGRTLDREPPTAGAGSFADLRSHEMRQGGDEPCLIMHALCGGAHGRRRRVGGKAESHCRRGRDVRAGGGLHAS